MEVNAHRGSLTPCILYEDPEQLSLLSKMISGMGYQTLPTSDPEEALRLVKSGTCRLMLADVELPGADAYEFLDRVLAVDPDAHVIVITAEYTLESALEAIRRGLRIFCRSLSTATGLRKFWTMSLLCMISGGGFARSRNSCFGT